MINRMSFLHVLPDFIALCPEAGIFQVIGEGIRADLPEAACPACLYLPALAGYIVPMALREARAQVANTPACTCLYLAVSGGEFQWSGENLVLPLPVFPASALSTFRMNVERDNLS